MTGKLPVSRGFVPLGHSVVVDVGGVARKFDLTSRGTASIPGVGTFKIALKLAHGAAKPSPAAKFTVSLTKGTFAAALADEGLSGTSSVQKAPRRVVVQVAFDGRLWRSRIPVAWTATSGVSGIAR